MVPKINNTIHIKESERHTIKSHPLDLPRNTSFPVTLGSSHHEAALTPVRHRRSCSWHPQWYLSRATVTVLGCLASLPRPSVAHTRSLWPGHSHASSHRVDLSPCPTVFALLLWGHRLPESSPPKCYLVSHLRSCSLTFPVPPYPNACRNAAY